MNIQTILALVFTLSIMAVTGTYIFDINSAEAFSCRDILDAPIAASGDNVYVTWPSNKTGITEIMFRASNDSGKTFGEKINLSNSPNANSFDSNIVAEGENVYVSLNDAKSGSVDTYVTTSTDGGKTFGPLIKINGTGNLTQASKVLPPNFDPVEDAEENTHIAVSGSNVYVVSWDKKTGNWEVFFAASSDNGKTFGETINISNTTDAKSDRAWLEAQDENVYVSWWETPRPGVQEAFMRVSNDNGQTFGSMMPLGTNGSLNSTSE